MKKNLVIFGTGDIAELAHYYFQIDSAHEVVGFTVDEEYLESSSFCEKPVVPFDSVDDHFPPEETCAFVALSYSGLNAIRKEKYLRFKELGYQLTSYVSSHATVLNNKAIGENCFILEDNTIQPFVTIGNNTTLWSGNHIGHHSVIGDHNFITSHVVISGGVIIGNRCFIGVNATLRDHISVGDRTVLGAGAVLMHDAEADGVYFGNDTERSRVHSGRLKGL